MTTFSIENFGCRATQADAAAIERELRLSGLARVREHSAAEIVVLNTCTVTAAADAQARDAIRRVHAANPGARILVSGCYAQRAPEELAEIPGVEWVVGNSHLTEIAGMLGQAIDAPRVTENAAPNMFPIAALAAGEMSLARGPAKILTSDIFSQSVVLTGPASAEDGEHTRPTLKIQDGCNHRCSYCVIPFVRGNSRSLAPERVIGEVRSLISGGAREIVLSGINLGSYGRDLVPRVSLQSVLRRILDETPLERLRLSSIEPMDVTEDLLRFIAAAGPRIARHLHMPLQSGSNRILGAMHRWYRAEHYERRIELIREFLPDAAIGADVIVGFPDETKGDHRETGAFIERLSFAYLHVFSFSARPGTAAADLRGHVPPTEIRARARELRALSAAKAAEFRAGQSRYTQRALTLNRVGDNWTESLTGNYLKVRIPGCHPANEWHEVVL